MTLVFLHYIHVVKFETSFLNFLVDTIVDNENIILNVKCMCKDMSHW